MTVCAAESAAGAVHVLNKLGWTRLDQSVGSPQIGLRENGAAGAAAYRSQGNHSEQDG